MSDNTCTVKKGLCKNSVRDCRGSTPSCTITYVGCSEFVKQEDCKDNQGALSGNTCKFSSTNCTSSTHNCNTKNQKCYICLGNSGSVSSGGYYEWTVDSPGSNCHAATPSTEAACSGTPSPKKYKCTLTDNSEVCVTAYDSAWAGASVSETGTSCREVPSCGGGTTPTNPDNPDNPSNPSSTPSSTPSSVPSSTPSNPSNITDNPKTGSVAIFIVWIIALGTLVYAGVYFKQVRENN